jgi:hypothetical protein
MKNKKDYSKRVTFNRVKTGSHNRTLNDIKADINRPEYMDCAINNLANIILEGLYKKTKH